MELRDADKEVGNEEHDGFIMSASSQRSVDYLFAMLKEPSDVLLKLQMQHCSLRKAKEFIVSVLESYPLFDALLSNDTEILKI